MLDIKFGTSHRCTAHTPRKQSTSKFEHVATHLSILGAFQAAHKKMLACTARSRPHEHDTSDHRNASQNVRPQTNADPNQGRSYESNTSKREPSVNKISSRYALQKTSK